LQFSGHANAESVSDAIGAEYVTQPAVSKPSDHGFPDADADADANANVNANRRNAEHFTLANVNAALAILRRNSRRLKARAIAANEGKFHSITAMQIALYIANSVGIFRLSYGSRGKVVSVVTFS
jgi:hypothetical protein